MKYSNLIIIIFLIILSGSSIFMNIITSESNSNLKETNHLLKTIILNGEKISELSTLDDEYYNSASLSYEQSDFKEVVSNCEKARKYYSENAQEIRNLKATLDTSKKVFEIYSQMLDKFILIKNSMYESCEHFESAARYYEMYYLPTGTESQYEMGNKEIESMNEKIRQHDMAVEEYNTLLAKYYLEIDKLIE